MVPMQTIGKNFSIRMLILRGLLVPLEEMTNDIFQYEFGAQE